MGTLPLLRAIDTYQADLASVTTAEAVPVDDVADHTVGGLLTWEP
jgi:hypothetical protein